MNHKVLYVSAIIVILAACLAPGVASAATNIHYTVQSGDTLQKIAAKFCTTWQDIFNMNSAVIGSNPNLIFPGTVLTVPANCQPGTPIPPTGGVVDKGPMPHAMGTYVAPHYTVASGDNLSSIGQRFGMPWQNIAAANNISGTLIFAGQILTIPSGTLIRVNFATGATSASLTGTISNGVPVTYVLKALAGQTMTVAAKSHAEALTIKIMNSVGTALALSGTNSAVNTSVSASLPANDDYFVTFTPVTQPASSSLVFDVTFTIPPK